MARKRNNNGGVIEYPLDTGDVSYRIQYRDASGKQVKETVGRKSEGMTRTLAKDERRKRMGKVADGYKRPNAMSFSIFAWKWHEDAQALTSWSDSTVRKYRKAVERLSEEFGSLNVRDVTAVRINDFKVKLLAGLGPSVVNLTLTVLGMILDKAVEDGLMEESKRPRVKRPQVPEYRPRSLSVVEARSIEAELAKNPDPQVRLAFLVFELTGMRKSELQGLRWQNVSFEDKRLRIAKSKTKTGERSHHLPGVLLAELQAHRERSHYSTDSDLVFCHEALGSIWRADKPGGYYDSVHAACEKIGITEKFRPAHDLRVTNLTEGALAGENPAILMARAGHRSFSTTKRYLDLAGVTFEDEAEKIAERRLGGLRVIEGGRTEEASVQEAR